MSYLPLQKNYGTSNTTSKFSQSNNFTAPLNSLGYGASFPFVPPLWQPQLAITALDKLFLLLLSIGSWSITF